jgi:LmbE family N-acetylglucosaminyl deacetylase
VWLASVFTPVSTGVFDGMKDLSKRLKECKAKRRRLLVIFPHPDDEAVSAGGILIKAKRFGWQTCGITLTKGEAGKLYVNPNGRSTKEIREAEFKKAMKILQVDKPILANFPDGKLKSQKFKWASWLQVQIERFDPAIIITYDHSGVTGHPDHISLSLEVFELVKKLNRLDKPRIGLFWVSIQNNARDKHFLENEIHSVMTTPTHKLHLGVDFVKKWRAIRAHRSQKLFSFWRQLYFLVIKRYEWYHKVDFRRRYRHHFVDFKI